MNEGRISLARKAEPPLSEVSPYFLRWAGGKRWLVPRLHSLFSGYKFNAYFEPFLGGGSFYLGWGHQIADRHFLSDKESTLIETYSAIKDKPEKVISLLETWTPNKREYLAIRKVVPNGDSVFNAARTIFLNRLCWNGLFRLNRAGHFNVPYSAKGIPHNLFSMIRSASKILNSTNAGILCSDFKLIVNKPISGDIMIVDPPYVSHDKGTTPHRYYNIDQFTWADQEALAKSATDLAKRGVTVVITPGGGSHILYSDRHFHKIQIYRNQIIAASADYRARYRENLIISKGWEKNAEKRH